MTVRQTRGHSLFRKDFVNVQLDGETGFVMREGMPAIHSALLLNLRCVSFLEQISAYPAAVTQSEGRFH